MPIRLCSHFYSGAYETHPHNKPNWECVPHDGGYEFDSVYYSNKNFSYDAVPLGTQILKALAKSHRSCWRRYSLQ